MKKIPGPGISCVERISEEGLVRLERQLQSAIRISDQVLQQWLRRYGDDARLMLKKYGREIEQ
ncbi:MAG: hypothetical protein RQ982_12360 [Gammaproteobacteria bacterium]|nr:hypothetical protein [Gammaproteobacteria bacterium]